MITEDYASFETAKLLKEKGFDEICRSYFIEKGGDVRYCGAPLKNNSLQESQHLRPTQALAMRWLREVHKIGVFPATYTIKTGLEGEYYTYGTAIVNLITHDLMNLDYLARDTYEDAVEAAIKYCLENLI